MLFAYKYVPHKMETMQAFIDCIFAVWCKAPNSGPFRFDLFNSNPELKEIMEAFHYSDANGADFFNGHVERIYGLFAGLQPGQITQLQNWYRSNNDLEKVCANDPAIQAGRYDDINALSAELGNQLKAFFKGLYSKELLGLAVLRNKIGQIDDHYQTFMQEKENKTGKCPFCGLGDIKGVHHSKREAYDHYLPKSLYPFNSINFRNLVPTCHECNSTYKLSKDPAHHASGRRKAFYPYASTPAQITLTIKLNGSDADQLTPDDIQLSIDCDGAEEEIATWKEIYGIEERYKAKCCSDSDGKYWLTQVLDEWQEDGRYPIDYLNTLNRQATRNPFADCNFLKKAFLEGCERAGLLQMRGKSSNL